MPQKSPPSGHPVHVRSFDVLVPEKVEPSALASGRLSTDKLVWLVATVARLHASPKYRGDDFVPLHSRLLKHFLGGTYQRYVRHLVSEGYLEEDPRPFVPGVRSKGYRVGRAFDGPGRPVPITDPVLRGKVVGGIEDVRVLATEPYATMRRHFDRVGVDVGAVRDRVVSRVIRKEAASVRAERMAYFAACELASGAVRFSVNASNFRLDTNVTNLRRDVRSEMTIDGEKNLVSIDVKNSQPFILSLILEGRGDWGGVPYVDNLGCSENGIARGGIGTRTLEDDVTEYVRHAMQGTVYESIAAGAGGTPLTRDHAKKVFLSVLYSGPTGNPLFGTDDPVLRSVHPRRVFRSVYPTVYERLKEMKGGAGGNREFAVHMQRIEAGLVLDGVAAAVVAEHGSELPFVTVHDSVICRASDVAGVVRITERVFLDRVGVAPPLEVRELQADRG